jgi:phosphatidylserine decarboxylase
MAMHIDKYLKTKEAQKHLNMPVNKLVSEAFFRDPLRKIHRNPSVMLSPADGVVLYTHKCMGPNDPIVEVKGKNFTVKELLNDPTYNSDSLVFGIFMTSISVHTNRIPTDGYLVEERDTPFIYTHNISMYALEYEFYNKLGYNKDNLNYLFCNERKVSTVIRNKEPEEYYLVQVADKDINQIVNWGDGSFLKQGDRFGQIRWGSQCDIIIPLDKNSKVDYEFLVNPLDYVKAGLDKVISIVQK